MLSLCTQGNHKWLTAYKAKTLKNRIQFFLVENNGKTLNCQTMFSYTVGEICDK